MNIGVKDIGHLHILILVGGKAGWQLGGRRRRRKGSQVIGKQSMQPALWQRAKSLRSFFVIAESQNLWVSIMLHVKELHSVVEPEGLLI